MTQQTHDGALREVIDTVQSRSTGGEPGIGVVVARAASRECRGQLDHESGSIFHSIDECVYSISWWRTLDRNVPRAVLMSRASADLLGADEALTDPHALYACHDRLLEHKEALFSHRVARRRDLFNARFEVPLYDLTSTYFESDPPSSPNACTLGRQLAAWAPGLSARSALDKFAALQMVEIHIPTTDGRELCSPATPSPSPNSLACSTA